MLTICVGIFQKYNKGGRIIREWNEFSVKRGNDINQENNKRELTDDWLFRKDQIYSRNELLLIIHRKHISSIDRDIKGENFIILSKGAFE